MKHTNQWTWFAVLAIIGFSLAGCSSDAAYEKIEPAELVDQGDGRNLVILTEKAAERLDIQTELVSEEEVFITEIHGGEVTETGSDGGTVVMVSLTADEKKMINFNAPARVFPLDGDDPEDDDTEVGFEAEIDEGLGMDDDEDNIQSMLYYSVSNPNDLVAGQRLMVEVALQGDGGPQLVVPFSSLLYDINGETYIYINPEPLQYLRVSVTVDRIQGDKVFLEEGPAPGTKVVTVGAVELFGTDTGVGK